MNKLGIFIFRRDLRLYDNLGLINLANHVDIILPIFILDENQINKTKKNKYYFSNNVVQFMIFSLIDLNNSLKEYDSSLRIFYGNYFNIVKNLINNFSNNYEIIIGFNKDYSSYSLKRDNQLYNLKVKFILFDDDYVLIPFKKLLKNDSSAYKQYGAFYKNATKFTVNKPIDHKFNFLKNNIKIDNEFNIKFIYKFFKYNINIAQKGGRKECLNKLKSIKHFNKYNDMRDRLDYSTTNLSAYLNFGCCSVREVYYIIKNNLGNNSILLKQLYWRDFFLTVVKHLPNATKFNYIDKDYNKIEWKNNKNDWKKLLSAKTGFLIIDAAINEMKITGFMHNRARMMVGMFWTKYLLIDTFHNKYGSQVGYSKYLVDAIGPSQNKMNQHWITEFDYPGKKYAPKNIPLAGRPMDISNNVIKKFDPNCEYIKKWMPKLRDIPNSDLFKWNKLIATKYNFIHPAPMFDSKEKYKEWIEKCKI